MPNQSRIMLVEDDSYIRDFLSLALSDEGYRVVAAENGWIGLTQVASFQPDVIILDLNLPVLNGQDFISVYAGLPQSAPVIGISAMKNGREIAERAGIMDFLEKPFALDELLAHIAQYVSPNE